MKKLFLLAFCLIPMLSYADNEWREQRGQHRGARWGELVGGVILGGIIAHEIDGHWYNEDRDEVRRIVTCDTIALYDQNGNYVKTERVCRETWVRIER